MYNIAQEPQPVQVRVHRVPDLVSVAMHLGPSWSASSVTLRDALSSHRIDIEEVDYLDLHKVSITNESPAATREFGQFLKFPNTLPPNLSFNLWYWNRSRGVNLAISNAPMPSLGFQMRRFVEVTISMDLLLNPTTVNHILSIPCPFLYALNIHCPSDMAWRPSGRAVHGLRSILEHQCSSKLEVLSVPVLLRRDLANVLLLSRTITSIKRLTLWVPDGILFADLDSDVIHLVNDALQQYGEQDFSAQWNPLDTSQLTSYS